MTRSSHRREEQRRIPVDDCALHCKVHDMTNHSTRCWVPRELRVAPRLDAAVPAPQAPEDRYALLVNPFYPKDPHASFGKHVLTPTLALTSVAGATPAH